MMAHPSEFDRLAPAARLAEIRAGDGIAVLRLTVGPDDFPSYLTAKFTDPLDLRLLAHALVDAASRMKEES